MGFKFIRNPKASYTIQRGGSYAPEGVIVGSLKDGNPQLTPHFKASEFACSCCGVYKVAVRTLEGLENVRVRAGVPLEITTANGSGYRCLKHNAEICRKNPNASPHSVHMLGYAVDVHPTGNLTVARLFAIMDAEPVFHRGGLGRYPTFVHGDCWFNRRWSGK